MDFLWHLVQHYWSNVQTFASLLSAGTTVMALSAAWLTFAKQSKAQRQLEVSMKQALLDALETELKAMEPWTEEHQPDHNYATDGGVFMRWHAPFFKPVFPIVHNTISQAVFLGTERNLSKKLTESLLVLEYQLNRFEQARLRIDAVSNANVVLAESVTRKLKAVNEDVGTANTPNDLTMPEAALMNTVFELNRVLHQECIGAANALNLHTAYANTIALKAKEQNNLKTGGWLEIVFDAAAWGLLAIGIALICASFTSFCTKGESEVQTQSQRPTAQPVSIATDERNTQIAPITETKQPKTGDAGNETQRHNKKDK